MEHELKIWPQYYSRVADGTKTFEVRKNDRGFQPGDTVRLREFDPQHEGYECDEYESWKVVGRFTDKPVLKFKIGYVLPIDADRVVFSLLPLEKTNPALG